MLRDSRQFRENAAAAAENAPLNDALVHMRTMFSGVRKMRAQLGQEFEQMRDVARDIKDHSIAHLGHYLEEFEKNVTRHGGKVHWAEDSNAACQAILGICTAHGATRVTKGKSMVSEEIGLNDCLESQGIQVTETDLGEYIVQLRRERPSHIIAPAMHITREGVADTFLEAHRQFGKNEKLSEVEALQGEAREILRQRFLESEIGITGANFLVAETGTTMIVTNEGNGDLCISLPRVHIVIASIEKVVPTLEDVSAMLRVLATSATMQEISVYNTFTTGPRRDGDVDGPEEFHVVLLDNGRSGLLGGEFQDMLRCLHCGTCLNHCPVYTQTGGHAYGSVYMGPMGAVITPALGNLEDSRELPNGSTLCGACEAVCPVRIPLPRMMRNWREKEFEKHLTPMTYRFGLAVWGWLTLRPRAYQALTRLVARVLARFGGKRGCLGRLPLAGGWTAWRDLPAPEGDTFMSRWQKGERP